MELLSLFNVLSSIVFIIAVLAIAGKLTWRFIRFRQFGIKVPLLLKRDLFLFASIVYFVGSALIALVTGAQGLGREWIWVVPRSTFIIGALIYWAWVEYHLEDDTDK